MINFTIILRKQRFSNQGNKWILTNKKPQNLSSQIQI